MRRRDLLALGSAALLVRFFASRSARADTYPSRPIKMIVSIAAGSVTDVIMRTAAARLQQQLDGLQDVRLIVGGEDTPGMQALAHIPACIGLLGAASW